jgi:resuscitation-promoting factor RpfB
MNPRLTLLVACLVIAAAVCVGCGTARSSESIVSDAPSSKTSDTPARKKSVLTEPRKAGRQKAQCDPNYSGCVPIASDVDCAGGRGNGPTYVDGPVRVIGTDIYGLDRDGDGIGCE